MTDLEGMAIQMAKRWGNPLGGTVTKARISTAGPNVKSNSQAMMDLYRGGRGGGTHRWPVAGTAGRGETPGRAVSPAPAASGPASGSAWGGWRAPGGARQEAAPAQTAGLAAPGPGAAALTGRYLAEMQAARRGAAQAQRARTDAAVEALEGNRYSIEQNAEAAARQAYISKMLAEKRLPQQLRAMGSSGGMTDSAVLRMNADYENSRNSIQNARAGAINDLDSQIAQAQAQGEAALGQQQSEWARQLAQMRYALGLEQAKAAWQAEPARQTEPAAAKAAGGTGNPPGDRGPIVSQLRSILANGLITEEQFYEMSGIQPPAAGSDGPAGPALDDYDAAKRLSEQFGRPPTTQEMAQAVYSLAAQGVPDKQIDAYLMALGFDPRQFQ